MGSSVTTRRVLLSAIAAAPFAIGGKALHACLSRSRNGVADQGIRVSLARFGGGPSVADNTTAMRAAVEALAAQGGGVLDIAAGLHRFASQALGAAGIALPSNVTIRGAGRDATRLQITGGKACNLFVALDRSRIGIEDMALLGNGIASSGSSDGSGAAVRWALTKAAVANMTDFALRRVHLENFRGPYWVDIQNIGNGSRRLEMRRVALEAITFTSRPGNAINPREVRFNSSAVSINGSGGPVREVNVADLSGDARHIKTGIILYQQVIGARLDRISIANAGREGAADDAGAYAIQIYDTYYRMFSIQVIDPVITDARSVGIYVAGATDVLIRNPAISGQTDQESTTLPKGAIAFNGTRNWRLEGGRLRDNWRDLDIVTPNERVTGSGPARNGRITGVIATGSETGISFYRSDAQGTSGISIEDCAWRTHAQTVLLKGGQRPNARGAVGTPHPEDAIRFTRCRLEASAGFRAIEIKPDPGLSDAEIVIQSCTLSGSNPLYAKDHAGRLTVNGCLVRDLGTTAGAAAATLIGARRLDLRDSRFQSPGRGGIGLNLAGSAGAVRGLEFPDCDRPLSPAATPPQLGRDRPMFSGAANQYVQNLEPGAGEVGGWRCAGGARWSGVDRAGR